MNKIKKWLVSQKTDDKSTVLLLIKGYFLLTISCFVLLALPFSQKESIAWVDQVFLATSIVSTTGLSPVDFGQSFNLFGQLSTLFFIQLGGIGYMALSSFIILKDSSRLPSISVRLLRLEFNLPQRYPLLTFIYSVFIFTFLIELLGAIALYFGFRQMGMEDAAWSAIFHSISAFCTAGFSLYGDSMAGFRGNTLVTTTIMILSLLGSIGFIVLLDFWMKIRGRRKSLTLTSKIILFGTFLFWFVAMVFIFVSDSSLQSRGWQGLGLAAFQSISAHTTVGFNNYDIGALSVGAIFTMIILMVIGASPAGTGGGIKTTSITALFAVLITVLKRKKHVTFFRKEIPASNIYLAISSAIFYTFITLLGCWLLLLMDGHRLKFEGLLFEVVSALSTVGLSAGITSELSPGSKVIISALMFIGRLGVLTFGFALISKAPVLRRKPKIEDIAI